MPKISTLYKEKIGKLTQYDTLINALNLIDETAEDYSQENYHEKKIRAEAYTLVADFINKHATQGIY